MELGQPRGETDTTESVSRVQVDYDMGAATLSFELMDSSMRAPVLAPMNDLLKAGSTQHQGGYTKVADFEGFPAAEEWTDDVKNGA